MLSDKTKKIIQQALAEDKVRQDKTTLLFLPADQPGKAAVFTNEPGILCGINLVKFIFSSLDQKIKVKILAKDGSKIKKGQRIAVISGKVSAILKGERVCLNFISLLSGISTSTYNFVVKAGGKIAIKDTRKTTPGLRDLEKYAVLTGGGKNHRHNLSDGIIIKDNHLKAAGIIDSKNNVNHKKFSNLWRKLRKKVNMPLEVEVESFNEFKEIIKYRPDAIMLDNFTPKNLKRAAIYRNNNFPGVELEASGQITSKNISAVAATGIDSVSIGSITHSPQALDYSLELV